MRSNQQQLTPLQRLTLLRIRPQGKIISFAVDLQLTVRVQVNVGVKTCKWELTSFCMLQNGDLHAAKR